MEDEDFSEALAATEPPPPAAPNMDHIFKIPVTVDVVLGSTTMSVAALMKLGKSAVVALDRKVGDPVDLAVNGRIVAKGEIVVLEGGSRLGVSLTEVFSGNDRAV